MFDQNKWEKKWGKIKWKFEQVHNDEFHSQCKLYARIG